MSDEQRQPGAPEVQIPDGGLGTAMPAWLQQPPAWKREPVEVPAHTRTLPPPDDSVIDPRMMLDIDDLPRWLQSLADHAPLDVAADNGDESRVDVNEPASSLESVAIEPARGSGDPNAGVVTERALEGGGNRADPFDSPFDSAATTPLTPLRLGGENRRSGSLRAGLSAPTNEQASISRMTEVVAPDRSPPWWLSDRVLGLVLLGIVLAMIYVVLAVAGVI